MFAAVKNGKGKNEAVTGLTDAQIKDTVAFLPRRPQIASKVNKEGTTRPAANGGPS